VKLAKYSIGIGDRFGRQGAAQLQAVQKAKAAGVEITPVWNKSNREHQIIGTNPQATRQEADQAVVKIGWDGQYFVDADHVNRFNVDLFLPVSDFFTLDVADAIGNPVTSDKTVAFVDRYESLIGTITIPQITRDLVINRELLVKIAHTYLSAIEEAASTYRYLVEKKEKGRLSLKFPWTKLPCHKHRWNCFLSWRNWLGCRCRSKQLLPSLRVSFTKGLIIWEISVNSHRSLEMILR